MNVGRYTAIAERTVADEKAFVFREDQRWAVSTLAGKLKGWKRTLTGPLYWLYERGTLQERRDGNGLIKE